MSIETLDQRTRLLPLPCNQGRGQGEGPSADERIPQSGPSSRPSPPITGEKEKFYA
jgi:hypothetical protein